MEDYFVVLFDSYTSTVPKSWLNFAKKTVSWPPRPIPSKLGMQNMIPDEKWIVYTWKKIMGPYDFLKACRIEQESIDMSTGDDSDKLNTSKKQLSGKRLSKKTKRYTPNEDTSGDSHSFEDEDEEEDKDDPDSNNSNSSIIKPKVSIVSVNTSPNNESNDSDIQDLRSSQNKHENSDASLRNTGLQHRAPSTVDKENSEQVKQKKGKANASKSKVQDMGNAPLSEMNNQNRPRNKGDRSNVNQEDNISDRSVSPEPTEPTVMNEGNGSFTSMQKPGCSKAPRKRASESENCSDNSGKRYATLDDLKNMHKKIVKSTKHQELSQRDELSDEESTDLESLMNLPLKTINELNKFNSLLVNDANTRKNFKLLIQKIDGENQASFTYRTLERIMTDDLATKYSYSGQSRGKNKEYKTLSFKNLKLYDILKRTIVYSKLSHTEREHIRCVKRWLNYAKQRYNQAKAKEVDNEDDEELQEE